MSRELENEVQLFIKNTGIELCENTYKLLKYRGNIMRCGECFVLVKLSRLNKPFWGLNGALIDLLINNSFKFFCIFLINEQEGWIFPAKEFRYMLMSSKWKKNEKKQYIVNSPLPDKWSFSNISKYNMLYNTYVLEDSN